MAKRGRPKSEKPALDVVLTIRGTPEYKAWVKRLAEDLGKSAADLFEDGIGRVARSRRRPPPPPRTNAKRPDDHGA